jgi:alpha-mannosidase
MLELAARARSFPGLPACRQGLEESYFEAVRQAAPDLPSWVGELYLETHRGTYTTQSRLKRANRSNELLLREAEIFSSFAEIGEPGGQRWSAAREQLRSSWEKLLLLQFHDILPGSSIGEVYEEALRDHQEIESTARRARETALDALRPSADAGLVAFNSLSWDRADPVTAELPDPETELEVVLGDKTVLPVQRVGVAEGTARIVFVPRDLPALGYRCFTLRRRTSAVEQFEVGGRLIDSPLFRIELDESGAISRLLDKRSQRELIPPGGIANELQLFQDGPEVESAWNVHRSFEKRRYPWDPEVRVSVVERGPVRGVVRIERSYRATRLEQDLVVWADFPRIDFVTRVDWRERQVLLKAAFPVSVRCQRAAFEIQFGAVERPTHSNTSWEEEKFEVCAHRWMDLSESGYGVSVLNDSRYGCDVHGEVLRLTLLRGAEWPDPQADTGWHELTYSLFPHEGDWRDARTVRRAAELNSPIICRWSAAPPAGGTGVLGRLAPAQAGCADSARVPAQLGRAGTQTGSPAPQRSYFRIEGPAILETLTAAQDGRGWILRVYEPHGGRGRVEVRAPRALASVRACTHVEEDGAGWETKGDSFCFPILPFQIRTFRLLFDGAAGEPGPAGPPRRRRPAA